MESLCLNFSWVVVIFFVVLVAGAGAAVFGAFRYARSRNSRYPEGRSWIAGGLLAGVVGTLLVYQAPPALGARCEVWGNANQSRVLMLGERCPVVRERTYGSYTQDQEAISRYVDACQEWWWGQQKTWRDAQGKSRW